MQQVPIHSPAKRLRRSTSVSLSLCLTSAFIRIGGFALRGALSAQRGSASQRADRGRPPDAQQRPPQPDGHRGRSGGLESQGPGPRAGGCICQVTHTHRYLHTQTRLLIYVYIYACYKCMCVCFLYRRQVNWREAKGEEEINIYQSERRRRTIHSLPKESRVSGLLYMHTHSHTLFQPCTGMKWLVFSLFFMQVCSFSFFGAAFE